MENFPFFCILLHCNAPCKATLFTTFFLFSLTFPDSKKHFLWEPCSLFRLSHFNEHIPVSSHKTHTSLLSKYTWELMQNGENPNTELIWSQFSKTGPYTLANTGNISFLCELHWKLNSSNQASWLEEQWETVPWNKCPDTWRVQWKAEMSTQHPYLIYQSSLKHLFLCTGYIFKHIK